MKNSPLTVADVERALNDERHLGWGLAGIFPMTEAQQTETMQAVADVATELDLDYEGLFLFVNSKRARWLCDDVYGCNAPRTPATVRLQLNELTIAELCRLQESE